MAEAGGKQERRRAPVGAVVLAAVVAVALVLAATHRDGVGLALTGPPATDSDPVLIDLAPASTPAAGSTASTPAATVPPTTAAPTTDTAAPATAPPTDAPPAAAAAVAAPAFLPQRPPVQPTGQFTADPYRGLGAWLDVYDWTLTYTGGNPGAGLVDIDRMASLGVRTLFIQASKFQSPDIVLEPDRLRELIDRAHADGMQVVAWYLPLFVDPGADVWRILSIAALPVDGVAVDIEARNIADVADRNQRLQWVSDQVRANLPGQVIGGIVLPPVVMEDINPNYWPGFPWAGIGADYDVWLPMAYWSQRRAESGWRDGYAYTAANIDRIRDHIGQPGAVVHPVGGLGEASSPEEITAMLQAAIDRGAIGGSIYDYRTTGDALWQALQPFNGSG